MSIAPTLDKIGPRPQSGGPALGPPAGFDGGEPSGGGGSAGSPGAPVANTVMVGVWLLVGAIVLLFAAFTSTLLTRRLQDDWRVGPLPPILWINTAILVASSAALEWARTGGRRASLRIARAGLALATGLGAAFMVGQVVAWRQLIAVGVGVASGAHSGFFYLLTGAHGVHLAAGVIALAYALAKVRSVATVGAAAGVLAPVAIYWHFVDLLWVYVFAILFWL